MGGVLETQVYNTLPSLTITMVATSSLTITMVATSSLTITMVATSFPYVRKKEFENIKAFDFLLNSVVLIFSRILR